MIVEVLLSRKCAQQGAAVLRPRSFRRISLFPNRDGRPNLLRTRHSDSLTTQWNAKDLGLGQHPTHLDRVELWCLTR